MGRAKQSTNLASISGTNIKQLPIVLPLEEERRAILAYFKRETAKIDTLIGKKRRLLGLIEEKRAALISQAVTKGMDPSAPMKDSSIEWLGQVPTHWQSLRLRDRARCLSRPARSASQLHSMTRGRSDAGINPSHLVDGRIRPVGSSAVDETTASRLSQHRLEEGDIVLARRGEIRGAVPTLTKVQSAGSGTGSIRVRPKAMSVASRFLLHALSIARTRDCCTRN